jgi:hypothetical protein
MGAKFFITSTIFCFFSFLTDGVQQRDVFDSLAVNFKESNSKEIAGYFSSVLELNILSEEGEYSKAQSELILRDFFSKHTPLSVKVIHRLSSSSNFKFGVLLLKTAKDNYRISVSMGNNSNKFLIKSIIIESDKE